MLNKLMQMLGMGGKTAPMQNEASQPAQNMDTQNAQGNACKTCGKDGCMCEKDGEGNCVNCGC